MGIEPTSSAWKAEVLPLNYTRTSRRGSPTEFGSFWWRGVDSNHRRHKPTDLQSVPFGRSGTPPNVSRALCGKNPYHVNRFQGDFKGMGGVSDGVIGGKFHNSPSAQETGGGPLNG